MSDTDTPQGDPTPAPQGADTTPQGDTQQDTDQPPTTDWQAQARKWEQRAKKDAQALDELKKQMQGLLTPEQVADKTAQADQATRDAADARAEALRLRVALDKGVPAHLADRLVGDDREALEKDAATLLDLLGKTPRTTPDASAGTGKPNTAPPTTDPNALLRAIAGGR